MKKSIIAIVLAVATLVTFIVPASAWSWKDDAHYEVAQYNVPIVEDGAIAVDGELDAVYTTGTKIVYFDDENPYVRETSSDSKTKGASYATVKAEGDAKFEAYIAVDTNGMYVWASVMDHTIFETTNTNGNDGDCLQLYFDWCTPDIAHPRPQQLYDAYVLDGKGWDYAPYKSNYTVPGLQYLGWVSADYNGAISSSGGFSSHTALGPEATDPVVYVAALTDEGWVCEWFIPWRDDEQKEMIANKEQFHCGIGFQACDDADIDQTCTPEVEENTHIRFDQRRDLGLIYYADYSTLADVVWGEYPENYWATGDGPTGAVDVNTADTVIAVVAALVVAGAGVVLFSKKREH